MKYIYFLLWLSFENIIKSHGRKYKGYRRGKLSSHIVGGVDVPITMYPHVAAITIRRYFLCGGSVVSDKVVLTAAHCVIDAQKKKTYKANVFDVFLGSKYRNHGIRYDVCKVVVHDMNYIHHRKAKSKYFYDIAVLMLKRRIKFGSTIQKVLIAPNESWRKEKYSFTIAGFGLIETGSSISQKLLATRMHYVDSATCNQSQANTPIIVPDHMFCMIGQRWTSDCFGDTGSGVIWRGYIVGLVSTGRHTFCGADMIPSMYTDVPYFRNWINNKIKEANLLQDQDCPSRIKQKQSKPLWKSKSRTGFYMPHLYLF